MADLYVILLPNGQGNATDKHLVVAVAEYVRVVLNEAEKYAVQYEHDDYDDAAAHRNKLNTKETTAA